MQGGRRRNGGKVIVNKNGNQVEGENWSNGQRKIGKRRRNRSEQ